jgi:hypothetical protein
MGLDMYLTKKIYVQNWSHMRPDDLWHISISRGGQPIDFKLKVCYVELQAAYWRKANQIHKWFVDHVQDGADNCQTSWVTQEQLEQLLATCKEVIKNALIEEVTDEAGNKLRMITNAEEIAEILPTQEGFFFGSTDYDEWYIKDIEDTITQLELALQDPFMGEFYYSASW